MSDEQQDTHKTHPTPSRSDQEREALTESERIRTLRERLYARDRESAGPARHSLANTAPSRQLEASEKPIVPITPIPPQVAQVGTAQTTEPMAQKKQARSYRLILIGIASVFFVGALVVASTFLFFGKNTVSGNNITIGINGPVTVGGGQEATFQVAVANQNTVPVEAATLVITYPQGTQSADGSGKELTTERRTINSIGAHEIVNVPINAIMFGEQNEEKQIKVAIEYRVSGSNATFSKETDPLHFKIGSSPVTLTVDSVKSISSGQTADITLTITSNSPTPLTDLLVKATYPAGFDESKSEPDPVAGQDTWRITTLKPNTKTTIKIHGVVKGQQNDVPHFTFTVGVPNEQDRLSLASTLSTVTADISIEQPFLQVSTVVNSQSGDVVVIRSGNSAAVRIILKNTLNTSIHDGIVKATVSGNAVNDANVRTDQGFYDSTTHTATWDSSSIDVLKELPPGSESSFSLVVTPTKELSRTPQIEVKVTVEGKRVSSDPTPQQLSDAITQIIKIESVATLTTNLIYSDGPFSNTGPTPPIAEKVTQYSYLLSADAGVNDLTGASMTAVIPQYVTWSDRVSEGSDVSYDVNSHTMKWNIGNIPAKGHKEAWVQVSFLPSLSQVGTTPVMLQAQHFKATDRFTGTVIYADGSQLSTSLTNDPDPTKRNGTVVR